MRSTMMLGLALAMMVAALATTEKTKTDVALATVNTAEVHSVRDPATTVKDMRVGLYPLRDQHHVDRFDPALLHVEWRAPVRTVGVPHSDRGLEHTCLGDLECIAPAEPPSTGFDERPVLVGRLEKNRLSNALAVTVHLRQRGLDLADRLQHLSGHLSRSSC